MKIALTDEAIRWFEEKFPLHDGESVRFFGKTYGATEVHEGFSVGMQMEDPENHEELLGIVEENGRKYFTTKEDKWFFTIYDLEIDIGEKYNEPNYHFVPQKPSDKSKDLDAVTSASKK